MRALSVKKPHLIDFASNDYLGIAQSHELEALVAEKAKGICPLFGSTGSRLLTGNYAYTEEVEAKVAAFHGYEAALLFTCGYMANAGLLSSVAQKEDIILFDAHVHASCRDGIKLSKAQSFAFRHNDVAHLEQRLQTITTRGNTFICIESLYSTDGSISPWKKISSLAKKYNAHLIVDEAHATGIFGIEGKGLTHGNYAHIITCGKALGVHGAFVLGSQTLKDHLINFATPFIYTTALPLYSVAAIDASYTLFPTMDCARKQLSTLMNMLNIQSPIFPVKIPGNMAVKAYADKLMEQGFDVRALTSPTVQKGNEMLRICLHAFNKEEDVWELKSLLPA